MSRPLRLHVPGMQHHVVARGNNKQCIYTDDADYQAFLDVLEQTLPRFDVLCVFYCLMRNHYHLLLKVGGVPLSRAMQQLNSTYCQRFNRRHGRVGHVLQGRFGSRIVEDGAYARAVIRYIALNPCAAGLVTEPADWPWSSYRCVMNGGDRPAFLSVEDAWSAFGTADPEIGRARLAEFVRAGVQDEFANPLLCGSDRLDALIAPRLKPFELTREHVYAERHAARPVLGTLFEGRVTQRELDEAAYRAFTDHAYTLNEIGTVVARDPSVVCRWIQRARGRRGSGLTSEEDIRARNKI